MSLRWKLAATYFVLIVLILGATNLFVVRVLERGYLRARETTHLANANIVATAGQEALLKGDRNAYYLIRDFGDRMGVRVLVLDAAGRVLLDSFGEGWLEGRVLRHGEVLAALGGTGATGVHALSTGERVLYATAPVLRDKTVVAAVMVVAGLDDLYAAVGQVRRQLLLASLGSGLGAALLGLWLAGLLTGPLRELTGAVRRMARGELEQRVPVRGGDELGRLAEAFNVMSARLAEVDRTRRRFLADVSHELKSPMSSVKALAQALLEADEPRPAVYREFLGDINAEIDRLARLVEDLLRLARLEEGALPPPGKPVDVAPLVRHVVALMDPRTEGGPALEVVLPPGLRWPVDPDLFTCILFNLLDNALRHTPAGGRVTVELEERDGAGVLRVADTGEGIPPEDLPHIFERFYRVDRARARATGGTGLGLAIVRRAVDHHGGTINVTSRPGEGTVFEVLFPVTKP